MFVGLALLALIAGLVVVGAIVTRLVGPSTPPLVIVQPGAEAPLVDELTFVAVEADGSRRELGRVTTEQLGGQWGGWPIVLSPDGHAVVPVSVEGNSTAMAVIDLRDLSAPVQRPDFEAGFGSWSPDNRLAGIPNRGGVAIFDPATGTTSFSKSPDENINILETDFRAQWAADGTGILAAQYGDRVTYGVLAPDGTFRAGATPGFDGALGARRVRTDGARLQCSPGDDSPCEPPTPSLFAVLDGVPTAVWTEPDTTVRIVDFAWGADDTVWFLTETLAAGPRTVQLVHIRADGVRDVLGTYDGRRRRPRRERLLPRRLVPDAGARRFADRHPDLRRPGVARPGLGRRPEAAHLRPSRRHAHRLALAHDHDEPAARRGTARRDGPGRPGAWVVGGSDGPTSITIRRATVETTSTEPGMSTMTIEATGPDTVRVGRLDGDGPCDPDGPGTYRWSRDTAALTLDLVSDPCAPRSALLAGTFDRELPTPDTGSVTADAGSPYVAAKFDVPFQVTIPAAASATVDQHGAEGVGFTGPLPDGTASLRIVVVQTGPTTRPG